MRTLVVVGRWSGWTLGVLLVLLTLAVGSGQARSLTVTTVTVEVIGVGRVTSDPGGVDCGDGRETCRIAFTVPSGGNITMIANESDPDWTFDRWGGDGDSGVGTCNTTSHTCTITANGGDHQVTANFQG